MNPDYELTSSAPPRSTATIHPLRWDLRYASFPTYHLPLLALLDTLCGGPHNLWITVWLQEPSVPTPLFTYLHGRIPVRRHEHVAILYRGRAEAFSVASFLAEGLKCNDLCVYLAPDDYQAEMLNRLRSLPVEVDRHTRDGTFRLHHGLDTYQSLQEWTKAIFTDAERAGAPSLRWLEEGLWPAPLGFPMPQFFEFHALLNYQVKHYPSVALCQYDLEQIATHHLFTAIAVHRHLLVEGALVRDNPFYIPAEKFLPLSPAERERDLLQLFRDVKFDVMKLLATLSGYGQLQPPSSKSPDS